MSARLLATLLAVAVALIPVASVAQQTGEVPVAQAEGSAPADDHTWDTIAWALVGVGVVTLAVGGTLYVTGRNDESRVGEARRDDQGRIVGPSQIQARDLQEDAESRQTRGVGLIVAGGLLALAGALTGWLTADTGGPSLPPVLQPTPGVRPYGGPLVTPLAGEGTALGGELGIIVNF